MIVHISEPHCEAKIFKRLRSRWEKVCSGRADLRFYKAQSFESHPDLLTKIWKEIRQSKDPCHIVSESDFVPFRTMLYTVQKELEKKKAIFCEFIRFKNGEITRYLWPLVSVWFWAMRLEDVKGWPREKWLENTPVLDDPGIRAFIEGIDCGLWYPDEVTMWPVHGEHSSKIRGFFYPNMGLHAFCSRHYGDDDTRRPGDPHYLLSDSSDMELPDMGYTLREHLEALERVLDAPF